MTIPPRIGAAPPHTPEEAETGDQAEPRDEQAELWPALVKAVMVCHQPDGSFWDYPLYSYHKPYGTGFALIALTRALAHEG